MSKDKKKKLKRVDLKKMLWLDTETTGLDANKHGVIQIAALYEEAQIPYYANIPFIFNEMSNAIGCKVDKEALRINGRKKKEIKKFPNSGETFSHFIAFLDERVNKFNKEDKITIMGYNVKFDLEMIHAWAKRENYEYLGSYLDWRVVDVLVIARNEWLMGRMPSEPEDFKLGTICKVYGINPPNHDALQDIKATRELYFKMMEVANELC